MFFENWYHSFLQNTGMCRALYKRHLLQATSSCCDPNKLHSPVWPCAESTILYLSKSFYSGYLTPRNSRHGRICTINRSVHAAENDLLFQESTTNRTILYYLWDIFYRIQHSKSFISSIWRWWYGFRKTRPKSLIGDDNKHYWFTNYTRQTFPEVYQSCQAK